MDVSLASNPNILPFGGRFGGRGRSLRAQYEGLGWEEVTPPGRSREEAAALRERERQRREAVAQFEAEMQRRARQQQRKIEEEAKANRRRVRAAAGPSEAPVANVTTPERPKKSSSSEMNTAKPRHSDPLSEVAATESPAFVTTNPNESFTSTFAATAAPSATVLASSPKAEEPNNVDAPIVVASSCEEAPEDKPFSLLGHLLAAVQRKQQQTTDAAAARPTVAATPPPPPTDRVLFVPSSPAAAAVSSARPSSSIVASPANAQNAEDSAAADDDTPSRRIRSNTVAFAPVAETNSSNTPTKEAVSSRPAASPQTPSLAVSASASAAASPAPLMPPPLTPHEAMRCDRLTSSLVAECQRQASQQQQFQQQQQQQYMYALARHGSGLSANGSAVDPNDGGGLFVSDAAFANDSFGGAMSAVAFGRASSASSSVFSTPFSTAVAHPNPTVAPPPMFHYRLPPAVTAGAPTVSAAVAPATPRQYRLRPSGGFDGLVGRAPSNVSFASNPSAAGGGGARLRTSATSSRGASRLDSPPPPAPSVTVAGGSHPMRHPHYHHRQSSSLSAAGGGPATANALMSPPSSAASGSNAAVNAATPQTEARPSHQHQQQPSQQPKSVGSGLLMRFSLSRREKARTTSLITNQPVAADGLTLTEGSSGNSSALATPVSAAAGGTFAFTPFTVGGTAGSAACATIAKPLVAAAGGSSASPTGRGGGGFTTTYTRKNVSTLSTGSAARNLWRDVSEV